MSQGINHSLLGASVFIRTKKEQPFLIAPLSFGGQTRTAGLRVSKSKLFSGDDKLLEDDPKCFG